MELDIEKFSPALAELKSLATKAGKVKLADYKDTAQVEIVKSMAKELGEARRSITGKGKELRQNALDFQRAVIAKEKELLELITPEEDRLKELLNEANKRIEIDNRKILLPERQAKLEAIGDGLKVSDEDILAMDPSEFVGYCNVRMADKNAKDAEAIKIKEEALRKAEDKIKREAEIKKREEIAKKEERERMEKEQELKAGREAKALADKELREHEEKKKLESTTKYREFRISHGWSEETKSDWYEKNSGAKIELFKKVGEFDLN